MFKRRIKKLEKNEAVCYALAIMSMFTFWPLAYIGFLAASVADVIVGLIAFYAGNAFNNIKRDMQEWERLFND